MENPQKEIDRIMRQALKKDAKLLADQLIDIERRIRKFYQSLTRRSKVMFRERFDQFTTTPYITERNDDYEEYQIYFKIGFPDDINAIDFKIGIVCIDLETGDIRPAYDHGFSKEADEKTFEKIFYLVLTYNDNTEVCWRCGENARTRSYFAFTRRLDDIWYYIGAEMNRFFYSREVIEREFKAREEELEKKDEKIKGLENQIMEFAKVIFSADSALKKTKSMFKSKAIAQIRKNLSDALKKAGIKPLDIWGDRFTKAVFGE